MELTIKNIPINTTSRSRNPYYYYKSLLLNYNIIKYPDKTSIYRYSTTSNSDLSIRRCYNILGVAVDSDQETVRQAFVKLVKRFHPDCGSPEADASRFQEIETAYRKLQEKFSNDRWKHNDCLGEYGLYYEEKKNELNVKEQDIQHTAPQHRQYLSYGGYGIGTPSQRQRQYQKMRAESAVNNVVGYRVGKLISNTACTDEQALVVKDKKEAKKIKTRYGFERLVEDLIQESMARGEFDNLAGQGKPLGRQFDHHNPYVDLVTHKLNQVLIDNGFKPEWITLQKEISNEVEDLRQQLSNIRSKFGPVPLNEEDQLNWEFSLLNLHETVNRINKKITKYNLVVPLLTKQMLQIDLKKEAENILKDGVPIKIVQKQEVIHQQSKEEAKAVEKSPLMGLLPIFVIAYFYFHS